MAGFRGSYPVPAFFFFQVYFRNCLCCVTSVVSCAITLNKLMKDGSISKPLIFNTCEVPLLTQYQACHCTYHHGNCPTNSAVPQIGHAVKSGHRIATQKGKKKYIYLLNIILLRTATDLQLYLFNTTFLTYMGGWTLG